MKKYFILFALAGTVSATSFGQTEKETKEKKEVNEKKEMDEHKEMKEEKEHEEKMKHVMVPSAVKTSFSKNYPGTTAKWEKEGSNYEAGFKHEGHEMSALYDADGKMTESEMEIKIGDLPNSAIEYVKANYKDAEIEEAAKITKADGEVNYEAEVKGMDLIFDKEGNFLREQKD